MRSEQPVASLRWKPESGRRGFTIVELVIVVLIVGIITAVAAPRYADALSRHRAEMAARRVRADLALARRQAMTSSSNETVTFDTSAGTYASAPGLKDFDRPGQNYSVDLTGAPYEAEVLSANFDGAAALTFNGYGAPVKPGSVVIRSGAYQKTVQVDANGRVFIQ